MQIQQHNSPNFGAKLINTVKIGKKSPSNQLYFDYPASFVQIDHNNPDDIAALENTAKFWEHSKYADNICYFAKNIKDDSAEAVYALTLQNDNLEKLDDEKILGLVHMEKFSDKFGFIEKIQVKPNLIYKINPEFKGVGTGILNSLKLLFDKIYCWPSCEKSVKNFYKKNSFVEFPLKSNNYVWHKIMQKV